jgi:IPT/TIG domain
MSLQSALRSKTALFLIGAASIAASCKKTETPAPTPPTPPVVVDPPKTATMTITQVPATATKGDEITILGTEFGTDKTKVKIKIGGGEVTVVSLTATEIKAMVADAAKTGATVVEKTTDAGVVTATSSTQITVNEKQTPAETMKISSVPASITKGDEITIVGTAFGTDKTKIKVKIGGGEITVLTLSATEIKALVADAAKSGLTVVEKTTDKGLETATSTTSVTVNEKPVTNPGSGWTTEVKNYVVDGGVVILNDAHTAVTSMQFSRGGASFKLATGGDVTTELVGEELGNASFTKSDGVVVGSFSNILSGTSTVVNPADVATKVHLNVVSNDNATKKQTVYKLFLNNSGSAGAGKIEFLSNNSFSETVNAGYFDQKLKTSNQKIILNSGF